MIFIIDINPKRTNTLDSKAIFINLVRIFLTINLPFYSKSFYQGVTDISGGFDRNVRI